MRHTKSPSGMLVMGSILMGGIALELAGCGEAPSGAGDQIVEVDEPIVGGGNAVSVSTRRTKGLVSVHINGDVNGAACSGAMLNPDAVLTASHCVQWLNIINGDVSIPVSMPRPDGVNEHRYVNFAVQVGASDMAILMLDTNKAGLQWPFVSNGLATASQSSYLTKQETLYGQGYSSYVAGGGVSGLGIWKSYRPIVDSIVQYVSGFGSFGGVTFYPGEAYKLVSQLNPNYEGGAWGDSGAPLFDDFNGGIMAVEGNINCTNWRGKGLAGDPGCSESTVLAVGPSFARPTRPYNTFIQQILQRPSTTTFAPTGLVNGWAGAPYGTDSPGFARTSPGLTGLRGGMNAGTSGMAFTLPANRAPNAEVYLPVVTTNATIGRVLIHADGTVNVQSEGSGSPDGNATAFTSLDGVAFSPKSTAFTPLSLAPGWSGSPYGTRAPAVMTLDGVVHFQGGMMTSGTSTLAFTLPVGYRPPTSVWIPVGLCWGHKGRLSIGTNGNVYVQVEGSAWANAQCFVSLEGASFMMPGGPPVTVATLAGSWTSFAFGGSRAGFRDDGGIIRLQGSLAGGTSNYLFTLPQSMRPAVNVYLYADAYAAARARILVTPAGDVSVDQGLTAAKSFISLDGLWFGI